MLENLFTQSNNVKHIEMRHICITIKCILHQCVYAIFVRLQIYANISFCTCCTLYVHFIKSLYEHSFAIFDANYKYFILYTCVRMVNVL